MIIHICGAPGSGKTTLGKKIKSMGIKVYDLDDIYYEFIKHNKFTQAKYQDHITEVVRLSNKRGKIVVFVGLNQTPKSDHLYTLLADHYYYIKIDVDMILRRLFDRELEGYCNWIVNQRDRTGLFNLTQSGKNDLIAGYTRVLSIPKNKAHITKFDRQYKQYQLLTPNHILNKVKKMRS
jgi:adenylate kinase family enzyme